MIQTLKRFTEESLFDATSKLLSKLNIKFDRETAVPIDVADLFDGIMPKYLTDALKAVENTYFIGVANDLSLQGKKSSDSLEDIADMVERGDKYDGMFIFACDAKSEANLTRTAAAALTRAFNRIACANPVILVIRQGNLLSLATCERLEYPQQWRQGTGERIGKVNILRNINCDHPHRGHINILNSLGEKQFTTFEGLYQHWLSTFSNELLTKKFYSELSDWYAWAVQVARFPNDITTNEDDAKFNHEACIRLITRLIFVWFLKEKKLIPEEFFDEKYIRENLIKNFNPHDRETLTYNPEKSKYYRLVLQNLFFAMLNRPIVAEGKKTPNNRRFRTKVNNSGRNADYNVNNLMRYEQEFIDGGAAKFLRLANSNVPFLNGGLFDCLDDKPRRIYYDGFSEREESLKQIRLPDYLFFGDEVGNGIDLSQWYGGDRNKRNVSVRGLIDILKRYSFTIEENTPLDQEVSLDPELLGKVFENLLAAYNPETQTSARKQTGSFYTPREIVQYMVDESLVAHLKRICGDELEPEYRRLLSYATEETSLNEEQRAAIMKALYKCRVLDPACGSGAFPMGMLQQMVHVLRQIDPDNEMWHNFVIDRAIEKTKDAFVADNEEDRKARLADIEEAFNRNINDPDYSRKLYLIENCIYGVDIQPIAVQISKLRFFISLVVDQKPTKDPKSNFAIRPLPNLESKFVAANTLIPLDSNRSLFTSTNDIREFEKTLQELNHQLFLAKRNKDKQELRQKMEDTRRMMAQTLENLGFLGSDGYAQLTEWNMFDQNASSSFFDPEWMFGVKDGFDIVIGNPPFIDYRRIDAYTKQYLQSFNSYKKCKTASIYVYFIEVGLKFLNDSGILVFINPYQYLSANSGKGIRHTIMPRHCLKKLIDVSHIKVFENADTYTAINFFNNHCSKNNIEIFKPSDLMCLEANPTFVSWDDISEEDDYRIFLSQNPIIKKIDNEVKTRLDNFASILCGLSATGFRNFVTDQKINENFIPFTESKQIQRYITNPDKYISRHVFGNKALDSFKTKNIFVARMTSHMRAALSSENEGAGKVNVIYNLSEENILYILALLNSKLLDYYYCIKNESKHLNGGAFGFDTPSMKELPIIDAPIQTKNKISQIVRLIIENKNTNIPTDELEKTIDLVVFKLYSLSFDEVLFIDPKNPIKRDEYDNFKIEDL